jgi:hypothetical protein
LRRRWPGIAGRIYDVMTGLPPCPWQASREPRHSPAAASFAEPTENKNTAVAGPSLSFVSQSTVPQTHRAAMSAHAWTAHCVWSVNRSGGSSPPKKSAGAGSKSGGHGFAPSGLAASCLIAFSTWLMPRSMTTNSCLRLDTVVR